MAGYHLLLCILIQVQSQIDLPDRPDRPEIPRPECLQCNRTNILFFGGTDYNLHSYTAAGYEWFKNFLINEFEFGTFSSNLVAINDDFNPMANSIESDIDYIISNEFKKLNSETNSDASKNYIICQGEDMCSFVENYLLYDS